AGPGGSPRRPRRPGVAPGPPPALRRQGRRQGGSPGGGDRRYVPARDTSGKWNADAVFAWIRPEPASHSIVAAWPVTDKGRSPTSAAYLPCRGSLRLLRHEQRVGRCGQVVGQVREPQLSQRQPGERPGLPIRPRRDSDPDELAALTDLRDNLAVRPEDVVWPALPEVVDVPGPFRHEEVHPLHLPQAVNPRSLRQREDQRLPGPGLDS